MSTDSLREAFVEAYHDQLYALPWYLDLHRFDSDLPGFLLDLGPYAMQTALRLATKHLMKQALAVANPPPAFPRMVMELALFAQTDHFLNCFEMIVRTIYLVGNNGLTDSLLDIGYSDNEGCDPQPTDTLG